MKWILEMKNKNCIVVIFFIIHIFVICNDTFSENWVYKHTQTNLTDNKIIEQKEFTISATKTITSKSDVHFEISRTNTKGKNQYYGVFEISNKQLKIIYDHEGFMYAKPPKVDLINGSKFIVFEVKKNELHTIQDTDGNEYQCWVLEKDIEQFGMKNNTKKFIDKRTGWLIKEVTIFEVENATFELVSILQSTDCQKGSWFPNWVDFKG